MRGKKKGKKMEDEDNEELNILSNCYIFVYNVDKWDPYEIAVFEAALAVFGKRFHLIAKLVFLFFIV